MNLKRIFSKTPMSRSSRAYDFALDTVLSLPPEGRILEIGTGQGFSAAYLSRRLPQAHVVALDVTYECFKGDELEFGPRKPDFLQASAPQLPLESASCDAVLLVMTFHCLPEPQEVIREAARVLKPGGSLLIADVNGHHWIARPFEWVEHLGISPLTHAYTPEEIRALTEAAGLRDFRIHWRPGKEGGFMMWVRAQRPK